MTFPRRWRSRRSHTAGGSPRRQESSPGRSRPGQTSRRDICSVARIASSPPAGCAGWCAIDWASHPTRSTPDTPPRSAGPRSLPRDSRPTKRPAPLIDDRRPSLALGVRRISRYRLGDMVSDERFPVTLAPDTATRFRRDGSDRFVNLDGSGPHELRDVWKWGTFKLTDEPLDEPPRLFRDEAAARGLPSCDGPCRRHRGDNHVAGAPQP